MDSAIVSYKSISQGLVRIYDGEKEVTGKEVYLETRHENGKFTSYMLLVSKNAPWINSVYLKASRFYGIASGESKTVKTVKPSIDSLGKVQQVVSDLLQARSFSAGQHAS